MAAPVPVFIDDPLLSSDDALIMTEVATPPAVAAVDPVLTAAVVAAAPAVLAAAATSAAAVVASASLTAETLLPIVQLALATSAQSPLLSVLNANKVHVKDGEELVETLAQIDALVAACEMAMGRQEFEPSPGFWSRADIMDQDINVTWVNTGEYETLCSQALDQAVAVSSVYSAWRVYKAVRQVLTERLEFLKSDVSERHKFCSCISKWEHVEGNIAMNLVNQCMEQLMVEEASRVLHRRVLHDMNGIDAYDATYDANNQNQLHLTYTPNIHVQLLTNRDKYMAAFARACLEAKDIIQISTCYVFWNDPAQSYILFDLLPHILKRGVKVQLLLDLMVMESATFKSAFYSKGEKSESSRKSAQPCRVTSHSFLDYLPKECPPPSFDRSKSVSATDCFQALVNMKSPNFDVQFWCARDVKEHYRVKNHSKGAIFDRSLAILGGSNLTPTIKSATADLDVMVTGTAAFQVSQSFESLYHAMVAGQTGGIANFSLSNVQEEKKECNEGLMKMVQECRWDDADASVAILRSTPSSDGEDVIYRVVLDKIRSAKSQVLMNMGHSCYPLSFARAVKDATERGVQVSIMVNSLYSNDLRSGQRDLIVSIRNMLSVAPKVEVYATSMPCLQNLSVPLDKKERPEFLHAKYVVVDSQWSAVGSWNLWNRSAFYEIEHEAFIESSNVASMLREKFERDASVVCTRLMLDDCQSGGAFCPKGCFVCQGFGPFYCDL